ncbi:MAG: hypothetical protein QIT35_gp45 [Methanophagales virus PBV299]|uniref:Glycosyltransferase 2-like domain-containing protein n=1 Tax=Methanophagales virus PBV299 TaxID=2987730 RepID=A0ABY6GLT7_9CAUD|nr:MAG: hypothetical protein QIT35_gp45 [Methanophagales virus PBV299]UYL64841.1 MAG: hypothetical protein OFDIEDLO_00045 [Methanophagales virus PBV299]
MKKVAIVKTFMRPDRFRETISSLLTAGTQEILVAYDGPDEYWDEHRQIAFQANQIADVEIFRFPYDYGLAACRNRLVEQISERIFLMVDDDIIVPKNIWDAVGIMATPNLAAAAFPWIVGGSVFQIDAWDIEFTNNGRTLRKILKLPKKIAITNGFLFAYPFDFVPNQAFWSRSFLSEFKWDEHYVIEGEHEDLAIQVKPSKWFFAVCLNVFLTHMHDYKDSKYASHRFSDEKWKRSWLYLFHKWNIDSYESGGELLPPLNLSKLPRFESVRESREKWINK